MLGVLDLEVNRYLEWVKKGPSEFSEKSEYSHDPKSGDRSGGKR
jgi:hypothetical protein